MRPIKYKNGDIIHGLKILEIICDENYKKCIFLCPICGEKKVNWRSTVLSGKVKSCGCNQRRKREWKAHQFLDLSGKVFGDLTVIQRDFSKQDKVYFICKCKCGKIKSIFSHYLTAGKNKTCGCSRKFVGEKSNSWKGCGNITGHYFAHIKGQAKIRNLEFNVTVEDLWELYQSQNGKCKLTGLSIDLFIDRNKIRTASLDRIDNSRGYIIGNIQWLHKDINYMKRILTQEKLIEYCHLISENYPMKIKKGLDFRLGLRIIVE